LRAYVHDTLLASNSRCREYLAAAEVETMIRRHESGEANLGQQIWCLLAFERWLQLLPEWRARAAHPAIASALGPA